MSLPAPSTGEPTRVAVVGLGYWGPNLVRNLYEIAETELTWVCDLRPERLETIGRRYPTVKRTTNLDEVLADPDVDAVAIATHVSSHHALAKRALEAGKHVLCEKPIGLSAAEGKMLVDEAKAHPDLKVIRKELAAEGIVLKDSAQGTTWEKG